MNGENISATNTIAALSSEEDLVRTRARNSLVAAGKEAVPFLVEALKNPNSLVRWEATKALDEIGDTSTASALVKVLEDDDFDVRWLATKGLTKMGIGGAIPLLHALIEDPISVSLREAAHHVLHNLAEGELKESLAPILAVLESMSPPSQISLMALRAKEKLEELESEKAQKKTDDSYLRRFATINEAMNPRAGKRGRRYVRTFHG